MHVPILLLCGPAGSGKDTVAKMIVEESPTPVVTIAQADPMKRFAAKVFGFNEEQLWGPSEARNAPDPRYANASGWEQADGQMGNIAIMQWIKEVLPNATDYELQQALITLSTWFVHTAKNHGVWWWAGKIPQEPHTVLTPRYMLQTLGTEWGRAISPHMWIDYAISIAEGLIEGTYTDYTRTEGPLADPSIEPPGLVVITDGRFRNEVFGVQQACGAAVLIVGPDQTTLTGGVKEHRSETELSKIPSHFYTYRIYNDKSEGLEELRSRVRGLVNTLTAGPEGSLDRCW
jgi:hypothetical protein